MQIDCIFILVKSHSFTFTNWTVGSSFYLYQLLKTWSFRSCFGPLQIWKKSTFLLASYESSQATAQNNYYEVMDDDIDRRRLLDETDDTGTTSPNSSFVGIASESRHGIDAADMVEPVLAPATERSAVARHYPPHHHHHHGTTKSGSGLVNESQTEMTSVDIFGCTHQWVVALFFTMSFFTYFDRGALSAALDHIQKQLLNDSSFKGGCLASSYLFGYCLSSPVFALLGAKFAPLKMSGLGLSFL